MCFCFICFSVFFLFIWRFIFCEKIVSSRYFSIFLYPGIVFATILLCEISKHAAFFLKKKYIKIWLFILFSSILIFIEASSFISYNKEDHGLENTCLLAQSLSRKNNQISSFFASNNSKDFQRISYYSRLDSIPLLLIGTDDFEIQNIIQRIKNINSLFFFFEITSRNSPVFKTAVTHDGIIKYIARCFINNSHKKEIRLYSFVSKQPNISKKGFYSYGLPQSEREKHYYLEEKLEGNDLSRRIAYFKSIGDSIYSTDSIVFPAKWWIEISSNNIDNPPIISLSASSPIEGLYSLLVDQDNCSFPANFSSPHFLLSRPFYSFWVRGGETKKSILVVTPVIYSQDNKLLSLLPKSYYFIYPKQLYRISDAIPSEKLNDSAQNYSLNFLVYGNLLFDSLETSSSPSN